ncbi:BON domain-containing protein [Pseudodesulfovibrio piezophilus]|uniref:Transport-associated protein n=1 Tax=Pseudodesulfovibrio piezophilus (strain DSM 21447 / JCM 15486 / C1TLV30) TaxID=1322246 RepID=M1WPD8_PSEP2|nr:BON domain-containing protein [Pseudodesulfovibrio piezophilus]CCH48279.1 Transport-associated protein [Pseudodesulfovibrio piezophilus C1TLV30]
MLKQMRHILFAGYIGLMTGCAVYPAVQVAGGAMTGYDAANLADRYLPRDSVAGGEICGNADKMLERRLRERLKFNNLQTISAHVVARQAFLIGRVIMRKDADHAIKIASAVQGIKVVTCKFYPMGTPKQAIDDSHLLAQLTSALTRSNMLETADLRVEVIQGNAILIGSTGSWNQKTAAVAIAHEIGEVLNVIDYIVVTPPSSPEQENEDIATN